MNKKELRTVYKAKRKALTKANIDFYQTKILKKVRDFDFSNYTTIHIFLPITRHLEINTYPIIDYLKTSGKEIIISKSDFKTNQLTHYIYDETTVIELNSWGIPEPVNAVICDVKKIDLVFVPMLISDSNNYRVGYGKGFYDRFLTSCRDDVYTIGLNFFMPIDNISDIDDYDVPLNDVFYGE